MKYFIKYFNKNLNKKYDVALSVLKVVTLRKTNALCSTVNAFSGWIHKTSDKKVYLFLTDSAMYDFNEIKGWKNRGEIEYGFSYLLNVPLSSWAVSTLPLCIECRNSIAFIFYTMGSLCWTEVRIFRCNTVFDLIFLQTVMYFIFVCLEEKWRKIINTHVTKKMRVISSNNSIVHFHVTSM